MAETPNSGTISTRLKRIAMLAREVAGAPLRTLAHHIDLEWLREAFRRTRKDGATGVDGQSAAAYAANLEENLQSLLDRAKSGTYRAPPVRRVHIPKGSGAEMRPIGIPTFEDKVLQRAVAMILEAVYEEEFVEDSYGFRPGRSAHQALEVLWRQVVQWKGGWVLEIDIRKFFDTLHHGQLQAILRQRVQDGVLLRLVGKWLQAGVMESGKVTYPGLGTPQGGVVSPLLANIFLHEVLDRWFEETVKPRLSGRARLIRYADDAVLVFEREADARRVMEVLPKRFGKHGLALHPEKTRLIDFRRPDRQAAKPGTFDLLGFTHHWGKSRLGKWTVKRRTAKGRFRRALQRIAEWCSKHFHDAVRNQHQALTRKLLGHYEYYGITNNFDAVKRFWYEATDIWRRWLDRRSHKSQMSWERMHRLLKRYPLPRPRITHSYLSSCSQGVA